MLILTRRIGEAVMIGEDVNVTILGVVGNEVRVGINAPREIPIYRDEVYEMMQLQKARERKNKLREQFEREEYEME